MFHQASLLKTIYWLLDMSIISEMLRFFLLLEGVWDCNSVSHPHLSCRNNKGYDFANRDCLASEWDAYVQFLFHFFCLDLPMVDSIFSFQPRQEREAALPIQSRTIYFSRAKIQSKDLTFTGYTTHFWNMFDFTWTFYAQSNRVYSHYAHLLVLCHCFPFPASRAYWQYVTAMY